MQRLLQIAEACGVVGDTVALYPYYAFLVTRGKCPDKTKRVKFGTERVFVGVVQAIILAKRHPLKNL